MVMGIAPSEFMKYLILCLKKFIMMAELHSRRRTIKNGELSYRTSRLAVVIGKMIRDKDPADANQPKRAACRSKTTCNVIY